MRLRGVCYDVGRVVMGEDQRPDFNSDKVMRELAIIRDDLHCNAVRILGEDVDRLMVAAESALDLGLHVWFSPELWDHTAVDTLNHAVDAAAAAEELRRRWPDRLTLTVGSELTLFMNGILKGDNILERIGSPLALAMTMLRLRLLGSHNRPLNGFLAEVARRVRQVYDGPISYASMPIEQVDWSLFDVVAVDYYRGKRNRATYADRLRRYFDVGKPLVITEVGCCTYQGAEDRGGRGFMIVDRKNPDRVDPRYVRDEGLQAREVADMLQTLKSTPVEGVFTFNFVTPTLRYSDEPTLDFDKASYSLTKTYSDRHGTVYPDMAWDPKKSFYAVAEFYREISS